MKATPLAIIAVIFAGSFVGRMVGVADAALNSGGKAESHAALATKDDEKHGVPLTDDYPTQDHDGSKGDKNQSAEKKNNAAHDEHKTASKDNYAKADNPVETSKLLSAIRDRSEALDRKELAIEDRIRILEILETRVDEKITALKQSNEALTELVAYADEASQNDIMLLSKMYEQMKPQKAGEIFDKMEPTFAAGFLTQMNSENAALILTNMNTDKAYETSMIIASRNAAVHER